MHRTTGSSASPGRTSNRSSSPRCCRAPQRILGEPVVVVPRHDRQPARPERGTERLEERERAFERLRERVVAQLDRVAEQHDLVRVGERVEEPRLNLGPAQQVGARVGAEVEVRHDRREHAPKFR